MKNIFVFIIALISLLTISCNREIKPTFETVQDVHFKKEDGMIIVFGNVVMHNPNSVSITVQSSELLLSINQKEIGKVYMNEPFVVEAKQDFIVPIEMTFETDKILRNLFSTGGLGSMVRTKTADFIVEGTVTVKIIKKDFTIPVSSKTEVDLRPKI